MAVNERLRRPYRAGHHWDSGSQGVALGYELCWPFRPKKGLDKVRVGQVQRPHAKTLPTDLQLSMADCAKQMAFIQSSADNRPPKAEGHL